MHGEGCSTMLESHAGDLTDLAGRLDGVAAELKAAIKLGESAGLVESAMPGATSAGAAEAAASEIGGTAASLVGVLDEAANAAVTTENAFNSTDTEHERAMAIGPLLGDMSYRYGAG